MSDAKTKRMIEAYFENTQSPMMFLTGFFQTPERNFYNSESVEIDVVRNDRSVSIAIKDLSAGARNNEFSKFTNKEFKAPVHMERIPINSIDLLKRQAGINPFENVQFRASLMNYMLVGMREIQAKIQRSIELQASQVLLTGKLDLRDSSNNKVYELDYKPKAAHFPTASTSWASATLQQKIDDLYALFEQIRINGKIRVDQTLWGSKDWDNFLNTDGLNKLADFKYYQAVDIPMPETRGNGGTFRGRIAIKDFVVEVWTYSDSYDDPVTGNDTKYIPDGKIIARASQGRLDGTFGAIPNIARILGINSLNILPELPNRFTSSSAGMDLFNNVYLSPDGMQLFGVLGSRPLLIPTAIDTFGCLTTQL